HPPTALIAQIDLNLYLTCTFADLVDDGAQLTLARQLHVDPTREEFLLTIIDVGITRRSGTTTTVDGGGHFWWTVIGIVSLPVLIALNGFFVAAEFALVAVRKTRLEELVKHGAVGARPALSAVENISRSIAATQLGITICSIALGWVAEEGMTQLF